MVSVDMCNFHGSFIIKNRSDWGFTTRATKRRRRNSSSVGLHILSNLNCFIIKLHSSESPKLTSIFFWSAPVAFRRVARETPEWTSRDSNHHRQSVSAGKTNAIPTEPSGPLSPKLTSRWCIVFNCRKFLSIIMSFQLFLILLSILLLPSHALLRHLSKNADGSIC